MNSKLLGMAVTLLGVAGGVTSVQAGACAALSAERTTCIQICNTTSKRLFLTEHKLTEGAWLHAPSRRIPASPNGTPVCRRFSAQSDKQFQGDAGEVNYFLEDATLVRIGWRNAWVGPSGYLVGTPNGYVITRSDEKRSPEQVATFTLSKRN